MKKLIFAIAALVCLSACTNKQPEAAVASTIDNLKTAITGETNASHKYTKISEQALEQEQNAIAAMFAAASFAENIHVVNHTVVLNELGEGIEVITDIEISENLEENMQSAIDGETYEFTEMYPPMIQQTDKEKLEDAKRSFTYAKKAEESHAILYAETLELLKAGRSNEIAAIWYVCPLCGKLFNTLNGYEICAICGVGKHTFIAFE